MMTGRALLWQRVDHADGRPSSVFRRFASLDCPPTVRARHSGGPIFDKGTTVILGMNSFVSNANASGSAWPSVWISPTSSIG